MKEASKRTFAKIGIFSDLEKPGLFFFEREFFFVFNKKTTLFFLNVFALTWVLSQEPRPNQTELTIGQSRETVTGESYPSSDYPEQPIPDIEMYWVLTDSRDFLLWPEYLSKLVYPAKQYLQ